MTRQLITRLILCPSCSTPISASYMETDHVGMSDICSNPDCRVYLSKDQIKFAHAASRVQILNNVEFAQLALKDCDKATTADQQGRYLALAQVHATLAVADQLAELVTGVEASLELQQENNQRLDTLTAMIVDKAGS